MLGRGGHPRFGFWKLLCSNRGVHVPAADSFDRLDFSIPVAGLLSNAAATAN
jgi:hypothetical protein